MTETLTTQPAAARSAAAPSPFTPIADDALLHTRPPANDADHMLARTVECVDGLVEMQLVT